MAKAKLPQPYKLHLVLAKVDPDSFIPASYVQSKQHGSSFKSPEHEIDLLLLECLTKKGVESMRVLFAPPRDMGGYTAMVVASRRGRTANYSDMNLSIALRYIRTAGIEVYSTILDEEKIMEFGFSEKFIGKSTLQDLTTRVRLAAEQIFPDVANQKVI